MMKIISDKVERREVNPSPNLITIYEQSAAGRARIAECEACDDETAAAIHKLLDEPDPLLERAEIAAAHGDVEGLLGLIDNQSGIRFVWDNLDWLKAIGKYEKALIWAYTGCRTNHCNHGAAFLRLLFSSADRAALLAEGPLPGNGPFHVFRGVSGRGMARRVRGISWTADKEQAIWFAERFRLEIPAVFEAMVPAESCYAYYGDREEREFLCDIQCPVRKVWPELAMWPRRLTAGRTAKRGPAL